MSIVVKNEKDFPCGHTCDCGKLHTWPMYVFAHKHDEIIHTCDNCGKKITLYYLGIKEE